jgi:hypothetical protein
MVWNLLNTVIASVALVIGLTAAYYGRKQVVLITQERSRRQREEQELAAWSNRADKAIAHLLSIIPRWLTGGPGVASRPLYPMIFPDKTLRRSIETYLVLNDMGRNMVQARTLTPELLRLPAVQETITRVEDRLATVRIESPELAGFALSP